jgi:hypothetical protein
MTPRKVKPAKKHISQKVTPTKKKHNSQKGKAHKEEAQLPVR